MPDAPLDFEFLMAERVFSGVPPLCAIGAPFTLSMKACVRARDARGCRKEQYAPVRARSPPHTVAARTHAAGSMTGCLRERCFFLIRRVIFILLPGNVVVFASINGLTY